MKKNSTIPSLNLTDDVKQKFEDIKNKLEKFKDLILKDYKKNVIGISLLPPPKERKEEEKNFINILILADHHDIKEAYKIKDKLIKDVTKIGEDIDKNFKPLILLTDELREACYDGKYELIESISLSAPLYDPTDILAALKIADLHKNLVIKKFEKYIVSYVAAGSLFRGEKSNDIDVFVVVDDTDVKKMSRFDLKERLRSIIIQAGYDASDITGVKKSFHAQVYILTDFWESIKDAHPVIFTFLRDGVPLYDRGVFMPWKLLLKLGRIRPSAESVDMHMDIGEKLLMRAKSKLIGIAAEDIYYSVLNPSQAALMLYGVNPPTPKETITLFNEIFVNKEKLIEPKYVKILQDTVKLFKDIEHGKLKNISGKEIDKHILDGEIFLKRVKKLFDQIEKKKDKESVNDIYNTCIRITKDVLKASNISFTDVTLVKKLKEYVSKGNLSEKTYNVFKEIISGKKEFSENKLTRAEIEKIRRDGRTYVRVMVDELQRKKSFELERVRIRFRYGKKYGEVLILDNFAFITEDIDAKERIIQKARLSKDSGLESLEKSSLQELEEFIAKSNIPSQVFLKEKIFSDLKKIFGSDIEILVNY